MIVRSYPKVNLALDILGKHSGGYHEIQTVFHQLSEPFDELSIEISDQPLIHISSNESKLPRDGTNTIFQAVTFVQKHLGENRGANIFVQKRIPFMSGLGGGSSNAVAVLHTLGREWHLEENALFDMAQQIGMDCVFFFNGGTALGEHFGEKITPLPPPPTSLKFEVIETGVEISSRWAYEQIDLRRCGKNVAKTEKLISALRTGNASSILENLHNDFEELIFVSHPLLLKKKREIESAKSGRVILCGSGGCLVRVYS